MSNENWTQDSWDDVSSEAPAPIEPNFYVGKIVKTEYRLSKQNNMCINVEVSLTGVLDGDELRTPRKHFSTLVFSEDSRFRVKQAAEAAGVADQLPRPINEENVRAFGDALLGCDVIVKTKHEKSFKDKNRTVSTIDRFYTREAVEKERSGGASEAEPEAKPKRSRRGAAAAAE